MRLLRSAAVLSVADQLFMVGGNFAYGIIYARSLSVENYGSFSIQYALLVLVALIHGAGVVEAACAVPKHEYNAGAQNFSIGALFLHSLVICGPILVLGIASACILVVPSPSAQDLAWLGVAGVSSLFYWSSKGLAYNLSAPRHAAFGSVVCSTVMLLFALVFSADGSVSPFVGIALGAAVGGVAAMSGFVAGVTMPYRMIWRPLIGYARWSIPAAGLIWLLNNGLLFALSYFSGAAVVAGYKASTTLLLPVNQALIGFSLFLLPTWSKEYQRVLGHGTVLKAAKTIVVYGVVLSVALGLLILNSAQQLIAVVFGPRYIVYTGVLQLAALLLPGAWVVVTVLRTFARALQQPNIVLKAYAAACLCAGPVAVILAANHGAVGAVLGSFLLQLSIIAAQLLFIAKFLRRVTHGGRALPI